mmetsp:Transcript_17010/g.23631  ORF Transcript_17010/g.23631 Transcript_17010/m.23631 type:complete len:447 (+) Transcript_17010:227-1567(+)
MGLFRKKSKSQKKETADITSADSVDSTQKKKSPFIRRKTKGNSTAAPAAQTPLLKQTPSSEEQETPGTTVESPSSTVLSALNVLPSTAIAEADDEMEVVYGDVPTPTRQDDSTTSPVLNDTPETEESIPVENQDNEDEVVPDKEDDDEANLGKTLLDEEDRPEDEEEMEEEKVAEDDEDPFDAKAQFTGDEMKELDGEHYPKQPDALEVDNGITALTNDVTRQLLEAFNCSIGMTACTGANFYDTACVTFAAGRKRPYFDENFTLSFLSEIIKQGVPLLYHQPPSKEDEDWAGKSVVLILKQGNSAGENVVQPRLEWSTMGGGFSDVVTRSVELLDIYAVHDSTGVEEERDDTAPDTEQEITLFSITTKKGVVHVFEAQSSGERDRIVNGLKNLTARFAYFLIAGDANISSELFTEEDPDETTGELPSLRKPSQAMGAISHAFLDD